MFELVLTAVVLALVTIGAAVESWWARRDSASRRAEWRRRESIRRVKGCKCARCAEGLGKVIDLEEAPRV